MAGKNKVVFLPRGEWQSLDCQFCGDQATLQAVAKKGDASAVIRCCSNPECKKLAEKSASDSVNVVYDILNTVTNS